MPSGEKWECLYRGRSYRVPYTHELIASARRTLEQEVKSYGTGNEKFVNVFLLTDYSSKQYSLCSLITPL